MFYETKAKECTHNTSCFILQVLYNVLLSFCHFLSEDRMFEKKKMSCRFGGGAALRTNDRCYMINISAMSIYGNYFSKRSSSRQENR